MAGSLAASTTMFALAHGVTLGQINEATGLSQNILSAFDERLPNRVLPTIWNLILDANPGRAVTLEMATVASQMFLGVLSYGAQFATNFREALEIFSRFHKLLSDELELELLEAKKTTSLRFRHPMDAVDRGAASEVGVALGVRYYRQSGGSPEGLIEVQFSHPPTGPFEEYETFFGIPVCFGMPYNAIVFATEALHQRTPTSDPTAFASIQRHLEHVHEQLSTPDQLQEVREAIATNAARGDFSTEGLAKQMHVSLRVLQRTLSAHGTTAKQMLEQAREAHAREFLEDSSMSIEEVAFLLGYSEERAFRRSFKRMTGMTPAQFRKQL